MIHQSQKVRKTTAEAQLPGIYTPGNKTQTWFHKKLPDPCLRDGGSYMGRSSGEGMEEIMPVVNCVSTMVVTLFYFLLHLIPLQHLLQ